ncbi:3-hydroxyacyl-ACP dehydratase FabZ [Maritimibacter sp. HL-12]|jgi:3-hydroxyacyl-[acyl-carrier-protein] dehydratase|uniref:3-hydroxyacyl-ACP dehydratase FabZ n=1 Tax=Maritimibacter sp. HL-12 TaxID=1162418 RepID=UPI000A0F3134|nr:3-hydroxyacyl-ACP dehydratase FabZ [Maritimibacter sp. HL-12]SMH57752.1 3-hydroxyacyl-[acyl-carrier-protein] dehydratase [Maritimibacter sp. HL-12]
MTDVPTTADIELIKRCIPHRYPFLFVDRVEEIVANESAVGIKMVTVNEPHFQGHFPSAPIMPGVTIVEAMAQTSAVMVALSLDLVGKNALVYFMGIDGVKFRRKVVPGDVLRMEITTLRGGPGSKVWKFSGKATVDGQVACQAEFSAMIDLAGGA